MTMNEFELDRLSNEDAVRVIAHRFGWARKQRAILQECLKWQEAAAPRPNHYFRWHLPRLLTTIEVLNAAPALSANQSVLDLSCFPPYSLLLEKYTFPGATWMRTAYSAGVERFSVGKETHSVKTLAVDLNKEALPLDAGCFDMVLFTETIEHILIHPQLVLREINRVLRVGGCVLISTPNVASWKKIKGMTDGNWNYDSPTFGNSWGHRFEYSPYQMRSVLRATGFSKVKEVFRDVYFDDPQGVTQAVQFWVTVTGKVVTGEIRRAAKMVLQAGSGMFLLWRKERKIEPNESDDLVSI
jgi:SAM-dependent methyltransferase